MKSILGGCLLLFAVGVSGCKTTPPRTDYVAGLRAAEVDFAARPTVAVGSAEEKQAVARFQDFLGNLTGTNIAADTLVVYAPDAYLDDTLKQIRGATNIQAYFVATAANVESIAVKFDDVTRAGDGSYYFRWVMETRLKKVAVGETIRTPGITVVRFDEQGRVLIHQDYWDSTAGLFEHVPVLGYGIRAVKARL